MEDVQTRNGLYGFEFRTPDKRRVDKKDKKTYNIQSLWQRNHEIINLAARGLKNTEIAKILNISPASVSQTLNSDLGEKKLSDIRFDRDEAAKNAVGRINELTEKALDVYNEILENESGQATLRDRKSTADTVVLELSGLRVATKIDSRSVGVTLTPAELEEFKSRGVEAARASGMIVDSETK